MESARYGIYLIPPPALVHALAVAHAVLRAAFGARTAGQFMPHCTIKGFTLLRGDVSPDELLPALDAVFARTAAFETEIYPPWVSEVGQRGVSVLLWLRRSEVLDHLHQDVWDVVRPRVAPDCRFTAVEPLGPDFAPHLSLVQADLPAEPGLLAQGLRLCQHVYDTLPAHTFVARDLQLIEFGADDWDGAWWDTLRYRQLRGWTLRDP